MRRGLLLLLALAIVAGAYAALPVFSLLKMRNAIEAGDAGSLPSVVRFEALRANLERRAQQKIDARAEGKPLGRLGARIAETVVGFKLDQMATPEGMIDMICDGKVRNAGGGCALSGELQGLSFEGPSRFAAQVLLAEGDSLRLYLQRQGLNWALVDLEISKSDAQAQWRPATHFS